MTGDIVIPEHMNSFSPGKINRGKKEMAAPPHSFVLYRSVQHCTIPYRTILYVRVRTVQHGTVLYGIIQYCTVPYGTVAVIAVTLFTQKVSQQAFPGIFWKNFLNKSVIEFCYASHFPCPRIIKKNLLSKRAVESRI